MSIQYSIPDYVRVSAECRELLTRIFTTDPSKVSFSSPNIHLLLPFFSEKEPLTAYERNFLKRITIPEIKKHTWFLKKLPQEMADGQALYYGDNENDEPSQTVEEVMRIIQAAKTPAQGSKAVERSALGLGDVDDLDTDVDTD